MAHLLEIRFHGRGGQGAWTASQILALAALKEGKYVQSFPTFGPERMGAPIEAYTRISDEPINLHCGIYNPDVIVVLDPTLLGSQVLRGMKPSSILVVNSKDKPKEIREKLKVTDGKIWSIDATSLAVRILGRGITNTAMVGAAVRATQIVSLQSVLDVIKETFEESIVEKNVELIKKAYEEVVSE